MQTIQANNAAPAKVGTLGISYPRIPSDVFPYSRRQAEIDVATLGWLAFQDRDRLELLSHEDETWSVFDVLVGDAVSEDAISAYEAIYDAAKELL